jgi:hypothetical protein
MFIDSELALTSFQRPPCSRGSSVLNSLDENTTIDKLIAIFRQQFKAQEVKMQHQTSQIVDDTTGTMQMPFTPDDRGDENDLVAQEESPCGDGGGGLEKRHSATIKQVEVLKGLLMELRKDNADMRISLDKSRLTFEEEVTRRLEVDFQKERSMLYNDIEKLTNSSEASANEASVERVRITAAQEEIKNAEREVKRLQDSVQTLRGDHLVMEEQFTDVRKNTRVQLEEHSKLTQLLKTAQLDARRARSECSQQQISERAKRENLELRCESQRCEIEKLNVMLYDAKEKADSAKTTAAEQLSKLVDRTTELIHDKEQSDLLLDTYKREEKTIQVASIGPLLRLVCRSVKSQQKAARYSALRFVSGLRLLMLRKKTNQQLYQMQQTMYAATNETAAAQAAAAAAQAPQPVVYAADAVAAAKSCVALLNSFVDKSQNQSQPHSPHAPPPPPHAPQPPPQLPQPPPQLPPQQQQQIYYIDERNVGYQPYFVPNGQVYYQQY